MPAVVQKVDKLVKDSKQGIKKKRKKSVQDEDGGMEPAEEDLVVKKKSKKKDKSKKEKDKKEKKRKKDKNGKKRVREECIEDEITPGPVKKVSIAVDAGDCGDANVGDKTLAKNSPPVVKICYEPEACAQSLTNEEAEAWNKKHGISLANLPDGVIIKPISKFLDNLFPKQIKKITDRFTSPTPIQSQAWPILMSGHDMVGIAATGSGKTLAFGLPIIVHILAQQKSKSKKKSPSCLILSPTRELCAQIGEVLSEAGSCCGLNSLVVYGGVPKPPQISELRSGVDILTATPGRLEDLMGDGHCSLSSCSFLVLDEADRMLDMGFLPHIRSIAEHIRADRQTAMFSATWPSEVQGVAADFLSNPVRCVIGSADLSANEAVTQKVEVIDPKQKSQRLLDLLKEYHSVAKDRMIIFVLYKKEADDVENFVRRKGYKCVGIHGNKNQAARTQAVEAFKSGSVRILIATDVAARGLDIPDVEHVVNYSFPLTTEDYVHRIGRTGRAGKKGHSHTFFTHLDKSRAGELQNVLRKAGQPIPEELLAFGSTVKKKTSKLYGAHFKEVDMTVKATKILFDD